MSDRLTEIRARLDLAGTWSADGMDNAHFVDHAPADISWLLDEVERLRSPLHVIDPKTGQRYTVERPPHDPKKKRCRCLACNRAEVAP